MKRLFGTHNKGKNVAKVLSEDGQDGSPPSLCDKGIFVLRIATFLAVAITSFMLYQAASHTLDHNGHCAIGLRATLSDAVNVNQHTNAQGNTFTTTSRNVVVRFAERINCQLAGIYGLMSGCYALLLTLICLYHVKRLRMRAQVNFIAKVELILKGFFFVVTSGLTATAYNVIDKTCKDASHLTTEDFTCSETYANIDPAKCEGCDGYPIQSVGDALFKFFHLLIASSILWGLIFVIAVGRHIYARRHHQALLRARELDEQEMKEEFARRKAEEEKRKQEGQGEGKGFVYRLLM